MTTSNTATETTPHLAPVPDGTSALYDAAILEAITLLFPAGTITEVRVMSDDDGARFGPPKNDGVISGNFHDPTTLAAVLQTLSGKHTAVFYTLNPCVPAVLERSDNVLKHNVFVTTKGHEIVKRNHLLLDFDPKRKSGISSTDVEKAAALELMKVVYEYLKSLGWPDPISADSGNGFHLLYMLDLPNTPEVTAAIKSVLNFLSTKFDTPKVEIDIKVYDPNRICAAYGTMKCKGENTPERPWRMSKLRVTTGGKVPVTLEQLTALVPIPTPVTSSQTPVHTPACGSVIVSQYAEHTPAKMVAFLDLYDLPQQHQVPKRDEVKKSKIYEVIRCPWITGDTPNHSAGFFLYDDGGLGFNCFHKTCAGYQKDASASSQWQGTKALLEQKTGKMFSWTTGKEYVQVNPANQVNPTSTNYIKGGDIPLAPTEWRKEFRNDTEMSDEPLKMLIADFLPEECGCFIVGLSGHMKTFVGLSMSRAFVYGTPLFGYEKFKVLEQIPVLYLIPESGEKSFKKRMKLFGLTEEKIFAATGKHDQFLVRTFSQGAMLKLDDERLLQAAEGRVVFIDTAIRFTESDDENAATENRYLSTCLFTMLKRGARTVIGMHHSPKSFGEAETPTLENSMRGSGDFGAMLGCAYAVRMLDFKNSIIQVECVKPRDFEPPAPFRLQGRPYIDTESDFQMIAPPNGMTPTMGDYAKGKKAATHAMKLAENKAEKYAEACSYFDLGKSLDDVVGLVHIGKQTAKEFKEKYDGKTDG
jgi:hypothetical protein